MFTMLERELVVVASGFEAVLCHAKINLFFTGCSSDSCFVDDVVDKAYTIKRAKVLLFTIRRGGSRIFDE
ncbi:hypothetical protein ACROYT_G014909 [Oculina patagonica]